LSDKNQKSLDERIKIEIFDGSNRCAPLINDRVPYDVLKCFEHLERLKSVKPFIEGFSICTFDSKMNFE